MWVTQSPLAARGSVSGQKGIVVLVEKKHNQFVSKNNVNHTTLQFCRRSGSERLERDSRETRYVHTADVKSKLLTDKL